MKLDEAIRRSTNWTAKLIIKDQADPLGWGTRPEGSFGTLYTWTYGHSNPRMTCNFTHERPDDDKTLRCICGESHGFPAGQGRLLFDIAHDERWEPIFPMEVLDVLARGDPMTKD